MRRYRFALESVLRARRAHEEQARLALAGANRALARAQEDLARAEAHYRELPLGVGPCSSEVWHAERLRADLAARRVEDRRGEVEEAAVAAATIYARWTVAARAVRALERLDERRRAEWRHEADRVEANAVDDVVTSRAVAAATTAAAAEAREGGRVRRPA